METRQRILEGWTAENGTAAVAMNRPEDAIWKQGKCEARIEVIVWCNAKRNIERVEFFYIHATQARKGSGQGTFATESSLKPESTSGSQRLNSLVHLLVPLHYHKARVFCTVVPRENVIISPVGIRSNQRCYLSQPTCRPLPNPAPGTMHFSPFYPQPPCATPFPFDGEIRPGTSWRQRPS